MRSCADLTKRDYDLIIVGAGIYGVCLALEATRRGLRPLLLEQGDFGSKTSFNHLRVIHGGLRYLQSMDLKRYCISVQEQAWFLSTFPDFVKPLECLMPLYNTGLKRTDVFKVALKINDLLASHQYKKYPAATAPGRGVSLDKERAMALIPHVQTDGLRGAAMWQDAYAPDSPRLLFELLKWSLAEGAEACNYVCVDDVLSCDGKVTGVAARDLISSEKMVFNAPTVINATGPDCRQFAERIDRDYPQLFPHRVLVWNVLFNRAALADQALAVTNKGKGHTYFMPPWHNQLMVGTGHTVLEDCLERRPTRQEIADFVDDINEAMPGLSLGLGDISRVLSGVMPGSASGTLASRESVVDHGAHSGPAGFYSVSGNKFTIARHVADQMLSDIFTDARVKRYIDEFTRPQGAPSGSGSVERDKLYSIEDIVKTEKACFPDDVILRRTDLVDRHHLTPDNVAALAEAFSVPSEAVLQSIEHIYEKYEGDSCD